MLILWLFRGDYVDGLFGFTAAGCTDGDRKRIVGIVGGGRHRQADDQRDFSVEDPRGKYQKRLDVAHFPADLRIAGYRDNVLPFRHPSRLFFSGYHRSAPTSAAVTIVWPPCRLESNRAKRCSNVLASAANGVMITLSSSTETRTRWCLCKWAALAMVAGRRTPRLLPYCLMSTKASVTVAS